jgi:plasmid maintenance system antidote protein VapI
MYPSLFTEMMKYNVSLDMLSQGLKVSRERLEQTLKGERKLTFGEAVKIKRIIGTDVPLEELFAEAV